MRSLLVVISFQETHLGIKECWEKSFKSIHGVNFVIVFPFFKGFNG